MKTPLKKSVCIKCRNQSSYKWGDLDDENNWDRGYIACHYYFTGYTSELHKGCYYTLEHLTQE